MRIGFVCNEYPPTTHGGIGTLVRTLALALARAGHEVRVAGVHPPGDPAPDVQDDDGVAVRRLPARPGAPGTVASRIELYRTVAAWARDGLVDLVEVPDWEGWAAGWPALPVPVVARLSGSASYFAAEMGRRARRASFWLEKASLERADFVCAESRYVERRTREVFGVSSATSSILHNPVEAPPAEGGGQARVRGRVVFAGTLTEKKGIGPLLDAWPLVRAASPAAELHVFGRDASGGCYAGRVEEEPGAVARGTVPLPELLEEFRRASVVVLPSYAEGFALTPLHAMSCGAPTIYTRRGSGPEVIDEGADGLLVDPDSPEEIAFAILALLEDPALAGRLGEAGKESVRRRFSLEALLPENLAFYRRCVAGFTSCWAA